MAPKIKCPVCNAAAKEFYTEYEGYTVKTYKCLKCGEEFFNPHDLEPVEPKG